MSGTSHPKHPDVTGRYYTPGFPIGEGKTDYEKYLRTSELLSLQKSNEESVSPEELLFQVTHQSAELWMKLIKHELDRILTFIEQEQLLLAFRSFKLVHDSQRLLIQSVDLIAENISIVEYGNIRTVLGQGSGMESPGFNWLLEYPARLWDVFSELLRKRKVSIRILYTDYTTQIELHTLAECLLTFDDLFYKWRLHHYAMVARTIGTDAHSLKGLSTDVLQKGVKTRFFPELLELRGTLTNESKLAYGGQPLP